MIFILKTLLFLFFSPVIGRFFGALFRIFDR